MYPVGMLFGLGFDTASEVGLLAISAIASARHAPPALVLSLPLLFAAGTSAMDTTDGVIMARAYRWALGDPERRILYNVAVTGLSVVLALAVGSVECVQVLSRIVAPDGPLFRVISRVDPGILGYGIVGAFLLAWAASVLCCRFAPLGTGRSGGRHASLDLDANEAQDISK